MLLSGHFVRPTVRRSVRKTLEVGKLVGGIVKFLLIKKIDFCGPTTDYINALRLCSYRGKLIFEWVKKLSFPGEKFLHQVFATIFVEHIVTYLVLSSLFNKIIYFHKFTKMNLEQ